MGSKKYIFTFAYICIKKAVKDIPEITKALPLRLRSWVYRDGVEAQLQNACLVLICEPYEGRYYPLNLLKN